MKTAVVKIKGTRPFTDEEISDIWNSTGANYVDVPGLVRKYYICSEDRTTIGGVYLWETKAQGETIYTDEWRDYVVERYNGDPPSVEWYDTSLIVDHATGSGRLEWPDVA